MALQTYADDSGSDQQSRAFVLAGFTATAARWAEFSNDWRAALDSQPAIRYFKSNEAEALKGQFAKSKGWTEQKRETKKLVLAQVIRRHIPERFAVAVSNEDFRTYLHGIPAARSYPAETPYFLLFYHFMLVVMAFQTLKPQPQKCDFIFDRQGKIGTRARAWWDIFKRSAERGSRTNFVPYMGDPPSFGTDRDLVALQAADLYAGELRRVMASQVLQIPPRPCLSALMLIRGVHTPIGTDMLQSTRDTFLQIAGRIEEVDPTALRYVTGQAKAVRRSRRS
jgi:hypothetical protein